MTNLHREHISNIILRGDMSTEEMIWHFKTTNSTKFELTNGYVVSYRKDCNYVWVYGNNSDPFELGLELFNTITKTQMKVEV